MRSYYEHLETAALASKTPIPLHPVTRSSAIFPVLNGPNIKSRILFLGYWILKRHIKEILAVVNLRSEKGQVLNRQIFTISEAKTYNVELTDQLIAAGINPHDHFQGSLEIEFFSTANLVFPFPAVTINYYGPQFSTVVHTTQRIYNDIEDKEKNSKASVPESGFNIFADDNKEPFLGLINGAELQPNANVDLEFFNSDGQVLNLSIPLGDLAPYEAHFLYPSRLCDLKNFLNGKEGTCKAFFHMNWIFQRLLVGNIQKDLPAITLTHTYYDCSKADSKSDYWQPLEPGWHAASLMVPVDLTDDHYTNINFYPIYSPSRFAIDVELYSDTGLLLGRQLQSLLIESPGQFFKQIECRKLAQTLGIPLNQKLGARIIARSMSDSPIPSRIKLGLDLGNVQAQMPCNICTNLQPFNPKLESKPQTFRWAPFLADQFNAAVWLMNSSSHINYERSAEIHLTFFREQDANTISKTLVIEPHGFKVISLLNDLELKEFFQGKIGWFTANSSNPYITTYYFAEAISGVIGGDHGF